MKKVGTQKMKVNQSTVIENDTWPSDRSQSSEKLFSHPIINNFLSNNPEKQLRASMANKQLKKGSKHGKAKLSHSKTGIKNHFSQVRTSIGAPIS
jgi:hypothetical protein